MPGLRERIEVSFHYTPADFDTDLARISAPPSAWSRC
jgi:hypothetical protein